MKKRGTDDPSGRSERLGMGRRLADLVDHWCDLARVEARHRPDRSALADAFPEACRPGVDPPGFLGLGAAATASRSPRA